MITPANLALAAGYTFFNFLPTIMNYKKTAISWTTLNPQLLFSSSLSGVACAYGLSLADKLIEKIDISSFPQATAAKIAIKFGVAYISYKAASSAIGKSRDWISYLNSFVSKKSS